MINGVLAIIITSVIVIAIIIVIICSIKDDIAEKPLTTDEAIQHLQAIKPYFTYKGATWTSLDMAIRAFNKPVSSIIFHPCQIEEGRNITAAEIDMPEDGAWLWWIDKNYQIEKARLKFDAEDHFYPTPKYLSESAVIGWLELKQEGDK